MIEATIGHNGPPDPIDEITFTYEAHREEANNWLEGSPVENESQMKAVDELREAMRQWRLGLERGQKEATAPLRAIYQAELDRWKPTIDDAKRYEKALMAVQEPFKLKLAAQKEAAKRSAWEAANKAKQEAEAAARQAAAHDIAAQREAVAKAEQAQAALQAASAKQKENVTGLKTVHRYAVEDYRAALHWIAKNDREAITAFIDYYVGKRHRDAAIDGVRAWEERVAR